MCVCVCGVYVCAVCYSGWWGHKYREVGEVGELLQRCCCCSFVAVLAEVSGASGNEVDVHVLLDK